MTSSVIFSLITQDIYIVFTGWVLLLVSSKLTFEYEKENYLFNFLMKQ